MKQKDIIIIIVAVFVAGAASLIISKKLFSKPQDRNIQVKKVQAINTEFPDPDKKYFNENSIDPTQTITIGNGQPQNQ